jgi:hypothetical protein
MGQFDAGARFQMWGGPGTVWLAEDALWITILEEKDEVGRMKDEPDSSSLGPHSSSLIPDPSPRQGVHLKLSFAGANPHPRLEPYGRLETKVSYFSGDAAQWRPDVPVWGGVRYVDLYPGVDLEIGGNGGRGDSTPFPWRLVVREGDDTSSGSKATAPGPRATTSGTEGDDIGAQGDHIGSPLQGVRLASRARRGGSWRAERCA